MQTSRAILVNIFLNGYLYKKNVYLVPSEWDKIKKQISIKESAPLKFITYKEVSCPKPINYIHETLTRNRPVLDSASINDIERMAFIGDRIAEAALCLHLAHLNESRGEWAEIITSILSNKSLSKHFIGKRTKLGGQDTDWNNATYIEACFYLDCEKYGIDFVKEGIKRIPFKRVPQVNCSSKIASVFPRELKTKQAYTFYLNG